MTHIVFQREIIIDAAPSHVWQLIATESGLRQWWGNTIYLEAKEGGRCEEWRPSRNKTSHWQGVVTQYTPPHQLMLTLRAQEPQTDDPELTTISIALEAKGKQTRVHVTQRAFGASSTLTPRESTGAPSQPQMPVAQLNRPASGSIQPITTQPPVTGRAEHTTSSDALTQTWQRRLTSLAAALTPTDERP